MSSLAPYMQWAKQHVRPRVSLAGSNLLSCELADLPGAREASFTATTPTATGRSSTRLRRSTA
jgi:hypothetical protein